MRYPAERNVLNSPWQAWCTRFEALSKERAWLALPATECKQSQAQLAKALPLPQSRAFGNAFSETAVARALRQSANGKDKGLDNSGFLEHY